MTALMWVFWVYLLLPMLSIILWLLGGFFFYHEVIYQGGYQYLIELCKKLGFTVVIAFSILRFWGYYNYVAFGKKNRRKMVKKTTPEELAQIFNISSLQVLELQKQKEVHLDASNCLQLTNIKVCLEDSSNQ